MHEMSYVVRMVNLAQKTVENELAREKQNVPAGESRDGVQSGPAGGSPDGVQSGPAGESRDGVQSEAPQGTPAAQLPFRVQKIVVQVGEMTGVIPAYLHRYYPEAVKGTLLEGSELETEDLPAQVRCLDCGTDYHPDIENNYSCPACESIQGKVIQGRDVLLKEVILEEEGASDESNIYQTQRFYG